MLRKTKFIIGLILLVQSFSFIVLALSFMYRNKKNLATAFLGTGILGALSGAHLIYMQLQEKYNDLRILDAIDSLCDDEEDEIERDIPVDETADETEFS